MGKAKRVGQEERKHLMSMIGLFPEHDTYIKKIALCDKIETVQHVIRWLENKKE